MSGLGGCEGVSGEKTKIHLSGNKFVFETMNNYPINTIDLSTETVIVRNDLHVLGDISSNQFYDFDASLDQMFARRWDCDQSFCSVEILHDLSMGGVIYGPEVFIIDPHSYGIGDASGGDPSGNDFSGTSIGTVVIRGNLDVRGDTTYINTQNLEISDNIIRIHANNQTLKGGGIEVLDVCGILRQFYWSNIDERWEFSGNVYTNETFMGKDLNISNNADISENLYVNGDVSFQRNLDVSGRLITTEFTVLGDVSFNGSVDISDQLTVYGDASFNNNVDISNHLNVLGDTSLNGNVDISDHLQVLGDASFNGDVDISGNFNVQDLTVEGDVSFNQNVDISDQLNVNGDASFNGNVDISDHLTVNGDTSLNGDVDISGTLRFSDILKGIGRFILIDSSGQFVDSSFISFDGSNVIINISGGLQIPVGTLGERPNPPITGQIRYNISDNTFEGYYQNNWGTLGGVIDVDKDTYITPELEDDLNALDFFTLGKHRLRIDEFGNLYFGDISQGDLPFLFGISGGTGNTFINGNLDISGMTIIHGSNNSNVGLLLYNDLSINGQNMYIGNGTDAYIYGPPVLYLDPVLPGANDNSGVVVIRGDLHVKGTETIINSITTEVSSNIIIDLPAVLTSGGLKIKDQNGHIRPFVFKNSPHYRWDLSDRILFNDDASFNRDVDICGTLYLNKMVVSGDVSFNKNVDISENLYVNGDVSFQRNLDVSGTLTATSLKVLGDVSFNGNVDISDRLVVYGDTCLNKVDISGTFDAWDKSTFHGAGQGLVVVNDASINNNLHLGGILYGSNNFIIDPAGHGDNTGMVIIKGGLQIDGSSTIVNSSVLDISDHRILLSSNATDQSQTDGAGIEISGNKKFTYSYPNDVWHTNIGLDVSGSVDISEGLFVEKDASFNSSVDISDHLNVNGDASFNNNVDITNQLNVNGDASFNKNVDISGTLRLNDLIVDGDVSFNQNVDISENLYVNGDVSFQRNLDVSGRLTATTFTVLGDVSFNGNVDISDQLTVYGDASFNNNVDITNNLNAGTIDISSTLKVQGDASFNKDVDVSENLYVNGDVSFQRNLDVSGSITATTIKVLGDVSFNGNVDISDRLVVHGDASFSSSLDVSNNLTVSGDTILSNVSVINLTNTRVVFVGENGQLVDSSNFTFDGSNLVIDTSSSIQIPVGTTGERPSPAEQGQIRYNITDSTFEGFDGTNWGSLGGVKDVDGDTYILAETSAGTDNDDLEFYTAGNKRAVMDDSGNFLFGKDLTQFTISGDTGTTFISGNLNAGATDISSILNVQGDASFNKNVDISNILTVSGETITSSLIVGDLTKGRIVLVGVSGQIIDSSFLTFDGSNLVVDTSSAIQIPVGTTGERPTGVQGYIRYNVTLNRFEGHDGNSWNEFGNSSFNRAVSVGQGTNSLAYSDDFGKSWFAVPDSTNIFSSKGSDIAANSNKFVAIGSGSANTIAYSYDGINWTGVGKTIFTDDGNKVIWGDTLWVATGAGTNALAYSADGINWNGISTVFDNAAGAYGIAYNEKIWLAGGFHANHSIAYSYDGINWTPVGGSKNIFSTWVTDFAYTGNMWVATGLGTTNTLAYSYDGVNWTGLGKTIFTTHGFSVAFNGIQLLAGGQGTNTLAKSTDGINWTGLGNTTFATTVNGINWNGDNWVVCGNSTSETIAYSDDDANTFTNVTNSKTDIFTTAANNSSSFNNIRYHYNDNDVLDVSYRNVDVSNRLYVESILDISGDLSVNQIISHLIPREDLSYDLGAVDKQWRDLFIGPGSIYMDRCKIIHRDVCDTLIIDNSGLLCDISHVIHFNIRPDTSFNAKVDISENLYVNGDVSFQRNLDVSGTLIATTIKVLGDVSFSGYVDISDRLVAYGDASFNEDVDICGTLYGNELTISNDASFNSNVTIENQLNVNGDTSLNGDVDISENLYVNGDVSFQRNLDVSGRLSVDGNSFDGVRKDLNILNNQDNIIVAGGNVNPDSIIYSTDFGETWNSVAGSGSIFSTWCYTIGYNGSMWVAGGRGTNTVGYSYDGINWVAGGNPFSHSVRVVKYNSYVGQWILGGQGGDDIAYSYDGINWETKPITGVSSIRGYAFNENRHVIATTGTNTVLYSDDLNNWNVVDTGSFFQQARDVIWTGRRWILAGAVGSGTLIGTLYHSDDGINWTDVSNADDLTQNSASIFSTAVNRVAYNGNIVVAVGSGINAVAYSTDHGLTFKGIGNPGFSSGTDIEWCGIRWIAGGSGDQIILSSDGINWTSISNPLFNTHCYAIKWNRSVYGTFANIGERLKSLEALDVSYRNVDISLNLLVEGDTSLNGNVDISENLYVNGDVSFQRNLDVSGTLTATSLKVLGDVSFNGNVDISDRLVANGDVSFNKNFDVSGLTNLNNLVVQKDASFNENLDVSGLTNLNNLVVEEDASFNKNLDVSGLTNLNNLVVEKDASFNENIDVSGLTNLNDLNVDGDASFNSNVDISDQLTVYGDASFNKNVDISGTLRLDNLIVDGDVSFNGRVDISDQLNVYGDTSFNKNVDISGLTNLNNLVVEKDASFNSNVDISENLTVNQNLIVDGDTSLNGNVDISDHLTVNGDASFNKNVDISGTLRLDDLIVDGDVSFNGRVDISDQLNVYGDTSFNKNVDISGLTNLNNLVVDKDASFNSNVDISENLNVDGDTSLNGKVDISDQLNVNGDASFNSNVDISDQLTVDGDTSLNGKVDISDQLTVDGDASFNKNVDISGTLRVDDLIVDGDVSLNGKVDISDQLNVFGDTSFNNNVDISGLTNLQNVIVDKDASFNSNVDVSDNLNVDGDTSLNNNVDISNQLNVNGDASFNGNVDISDNLNVNGIAFDGLKQDIDMIKNNENIIVAGGKDDNMISYSTDFGVTWTPVANSSTIFTTTVNSIDFNGSMWVAGGRGTNTLAYSMDGKEWVGLGTPVFTHSGRPIKWHSNTGRWIAGGQGTNTLAYSYNGIDWVGLGNSSNNAKVTGLDFNDTRYITVGESSPTIAYSDDLENWTAVTDSTSIFQRGKGVVWAGERWIAVGSKGTGNSTIVYSDDNGVTWIDASNANNLAQTSTNVFSTVCNGVAYNGSTLVAVGNGTSTVAYSTDKGLTWTGMNLSAILGHPQGMCVEWIGTKWIVGGMGDTIIYSDDAINWTVVDTPPFNTQCNTIAWNNSLYGTMRAINDKLNELDSKIDVSYRYVDISLDLLVERDASFNRYVDISDNLNVGNKVTVEGDTELKNKLDVSGLATFSGSGQGVFVENDISINSNIHFGGGHLYGPPIIYIDPVFNNFGDNSGTVVIRGDLDVKGTETTVNTQTTEVSHNIIAHIPAALSDGGLVVRDQNDHERPFVFKNAPDYVWDLSDSIIFNENTEVKGDASFNNDVDICGTLKVKDLNVYGDVSFLGYVDIAKRLVLYGDASFAQDVDISGFLTVDGPTTCTDFSATRIRVDVNRIAIGDNAGAILQGSDSISIGKYAGNTEQGNKSISIGEDTGRIRQGEETLAIGFQAGKTDQSDFAVAIGSESGLTNQGRLSTSIGYNAGRTDQSSNAVAIGAQAGSSNQGTEAVALGHQAGFMNQGAYAIAIGSASSIVNQKPSSIIMSASGHIETDFENALYINPIRNTDSSFILQYNSTSKEVTYSSNINIDSLVVTDASFTNVDISNQLLVTGDASFNNNVDISNRLVANGDASFNENVDVSGTLTTNDLVVRGDVSFNKNVDISENLYVNGDVSFQRNVDVSGVLVPTYLNVLQDASFNASVDISENLTVNGYSFEGVRSATEYLHNTENLIVAVGGNDARISISRDFGITWSELPDSVNIFQDSNPGGTAIAYNGHRWVAIGNKVNIAAYSDDGINWTGYNETTPGVNGPFGNRGWVIKWNPKLGMFVAGGHRSGGGTDLCNNTIAYTKDGASWIPGGNPLTAKVTGLDFDNNERYVYVGVGTASALSTIAYSDDRVNFVGLGNTIFDQGKEVLWLGGSRWVAVGIPGSSSIAISDTSGETWADASFNGGSSTTLFTECWVVGWNGSRVIAAGKGTHRIAYSDDRGSTWTAVPNSTDFFSGEIVNCVVWCGVHWIIGGATPDRLIYSRDGITWTAVVNATHTAFSSQCSSLAWNKNYNAALAYVANNSNVDTSIDVSYRNVDISNKLLVEGDASFNNNVDISNHFTVLGDASFQGSTNFQDYVSFQNYVDVSNLIVGALPNVNGWAGIKHKDNLANTGYALIQNSDGKTVIGSTNPQPLEFRNSGNLLGTFRNGKFGIGVSIPGSYLTVSGDSSLLGDVDISENLYVNGDVSFQRNLDVSGVLSATTLSVMDVSFRNVDISMNLSVDGNATISGSILTPEADAGLSGEVLTSLGPQQGWEWRTLFVNDLSDAISNVSNFSNSLKIGSNKTGALNNCFSNTFVGIDSGNSIISASNNTALGFGTLNELTTGDANTAIGQGTLEYCTTGASNTAVGNLALAGDDITKLTGNFNTAFGKNCMFKIKTGSANSGMGNKSLFDLTDGSYNIAMGNNSLANVTTGSYNIGFGMYSGRALKTGEHNIFIGYNSETLSKSTSSNNQIVIGSCLLGASQRNYGHGDNTTTIGNLGTTRTVIYGLLDISNLKAIDASFTGSIHVDNDASFNQNIFAKAITCDDFSADRIKVDTNAIGIGIEAGFENQGLHGIGIGTLAGNRDQSNNAIGIGLTAGERYQELAAIAIGEKAGQLSQGTNSVAIGNSAGNNQQGKYSIAVGYRAGDNQQHENSIILNANDQPLDSDFSNALYINPIRNFDGSYILQYNTTTKEVTYSNNLELNNLNVLDISCRNIDVSMRLFVEGDASFNSNVDVCGRIVTDDFEATRIKAKTDGTIAIGKEAGLQSQNIESIAIGSLTGRIDQSLNAIAIGNSAGQTYQSRAAVSVGHLAGNLRQGQVAVAIGTSSGQTAQGDQSIAIGGFAGYNNLGKNSVAIGSQAGLFNPTNVENAIMINSTGTALNADISHALYIKPVRPFHNLDVLQYNSTTGEITYSSKLTITDASFTNVDISNNLNVDNKLVVQGDVSLNGKVDISDNLNVLSNLDVSNNLNVGNNLVVEGDASFNKNLDISGELTVDDYLYSNVRYQVDKNKYDISPTNHDNIIVAVAAYNSSAASEEQYNIVYSLDNATTWNGVTNSRSIFGKRANAIANNGYRWVAGGQQDTNGHPTLAYSDDGITWTTIDTPVAFSIRCWVAYWCEYYQRWYAGGHGGNTIIYSNDGINWISGGSPISTKVLTITSNGKRIFIGGEGAGDNDFAYSDDGINWTPLYTLFTSVRSIATDGSMVVMAGQVGPSNTNSLMYSKDNGSTWIDCSNAANGNGSSNIFSVRGHNVKYNGTRWLVGGFGGNSLAYSDDGINWTKITDSQTNYFGSCNYVEWTGTRWVAVGDGNNIIYSDDNAITWTIISTTDRTLFNNVFAISSNRSVFSYIRDFHSNIDDISNALANISTNLTGDYATKTEFDDLSTNHYELDASFDVLWDNVVLQHSDASLANLDISQNLKVGYDTDTIGYIGRAAIGHNTFHPDFASFAHLDSNASNGYAIMQKADGRTIINAAGGQFISNRINNVQYTNLNQNQIQLGSSDIDNYKVVVDADLSCVKNVDICLNLEVRGDASFNEFVDISNLRVGHNHGQDNGSVSTSTNSASQTLLGNMRLGYMGSGFNNWVGFKHNALSSKNGYAIIQNSDGTTLLNALSGQGINFNIHNSVKMKLTSDGNFGIGLAGSPTYRLEVSGNSLFRSNVDISENLYVNGDVSFQRNLDVSGNLNVKNLTIQDLIVNGDASFNNNVDVTNTLKLKGDSSWPIYIDQTKSTETSDSFTTNGILINNDTNKNSELLRVQYNGSHQYGGALIYNGSNSGVKNTIAFTMDKEDSGTPIQCFTMNQNGDVGIGRGGNSMLPEATLHISSAQDGPCDILLEGDEGNNASGGTPQIYFKQGAGMWTSGIGSFETEKLIFKNSRENGGIIFETGNRKTNTSKDIFNGFTTERMRITETGDIGIGLINPGVSFEVVGDVSFGKSLFVAGDTSLNSNVQINGAIITSTGDKGVSGEILISTGTEWHWNSLGLNDLHDAISNITDFSNSIKIGSSVTGTLNNAYGNTLLGRNVAESITNGIKNTSIGFETLKNIIGGDFNTGIGSEALLSLISGDGNTGLGNNSLNLVTNGNYNTAVGAGALGFTTTSNNNTALGRKAGETNTTGSNNIFIGYKAVSDISEADNQIIIGYDTSGLANYGSNTVLIGNNDICNTYLKGTVVYTDISGPVVVDDLTAVTDLSKKVATAGSIRKYVKETAPFIFNTVNIETDKKLRNKYSIAYPTDERMNIKQSFINATYNGEFDDYNPGTQQITFGEANKKIYVAVGKTGSVTNTISYSYDSKKWYSAGKPIETRGYSIDYNGIVWVAVGQGSGNTIAFSYDGIHWEGIGKTIFSLKGLHIKYESNMWVACGEGTNRLAYSFNGTTWYPGRTTTHTNTTNIFSTRAKCTAYNGMVWVAVGIGTNSIAYSEDGITWIGLGVADLANGYSVACDGTKFIVAGDDSSGDGKMLSSNNGKDWTNIAGISTLFNTRVAGICCDGNNTWCATGRDNNYMAYSKDNGITWTAISNPVFTGMGNSNINWDGNYFFATTDAGDNLTAKSKDGVTWQAVNVFTDAGGTVISNYNKRNRITFSKNISVTGGKGDDYSIAYTTGLYDISNIGLQWTGVSGSNDILAQCNDIAHNGDIWIAAGQKASGTTFTLAYSENGIIWNGIHNTDQLFQGTNQATSIAWNGKLWVAIGKGSNDATITNVAYSADGFKWKKVTSTITDLDGTVADVKALATNGKVWVISGYPGKFAYSTDLITWTAGYNSPLGTSVNSIVWNGSIFLATGKGSSAKIAYSHDGDFWTGFDSIFTDAGRGAAWSDTLKIWVVVGNGTNSIGYSKDATIWTAVTNSTNIFTSGHSVNWNGHRFVAVGEGNNSIAYSDDGINWVGLGNNIFTGSSSPNGLCIASSNRTPVVSISHPFIALGRNNSSVHHNALSYSIDGLSWNMTGRKHFRTQGQSQYFCQLAYNGIYWIAVGAGEVNATNTDGNTMLYSRNGLDWIGLGNDLFTTTGYAVAWNGNMWVAGGQGSSTLATSTDGVNWTKINNSPFTTRCVGVVWTGAQWIAAGHGGNKIATSPDGYTWTGRGTTIFFGNMNAIATNGIITVACCNEISGSDDVLGYSYDGITWTGGVTTFAGNPAGTTVLFDHSCTSVATNGKIWIAGGRGKNTGAYSYDGINWVDNNAIIGSGGGVNGRTYGIAWNGQYWIAVGQGQPDCVAFSVDGIKWILIDDTDDTPFKTAGFGITSRNNVIGEYTENEFIVDKFIQPSSNIIVFHNSGYYNNYNESELDSIGISIKGEKDNLN